MSWFTSLIANELGSEKQSGSADYLSVSAVLNRVFAGWIVRRSLLLWFLTRSMTALFLFLTSSPGDPWTTRMLGGIETRVMILGIVVFLTLFESRRRGELLLCANMGYGPLTLLTIAATAPTFLELTLLTLH